ncbi:alpha/beta hydrolase [Streptomyces sp. NPDC093252]|uniref:alpha/beta hydrolase n=1 Tax=Streptomyces sp. NPDC093252 TaxID=3154980 RepID=UPI00344012E2
MTTDATPAPTPTATPAPTEYSDHHAPAGLRTRGTVVVVPGRGETRATYTRLARRLAADAYRVRVIDAPEPGLDPAGFAHRVTDAAAGTAGEEGVVRPLVLLGADSGALAVAAVPDGGPDDDPAALRPDALVLAGPPAAHHTATATATTWEQELDLRTSCPAHRGTLTEDTGVRRGALTTPLPEALLTAARQAEPEVPVLLLAGDADPLTDHETLTHTAKSLARARLAVVRGAHHDVLNDLQHRSVAAEIVTFLETVRNDLTPLIRVESSAW